MKLVRKICWCIVALFASMPLCAQDGKSVQTTPAVTDEVMLSYREKIFLHVNSNFLLTGETIYFSVYCRDAYRFMPSSLSRVAYIEIVDKERRPFWQTKVNLQDGRGHAEFFLPSGMPSGNYSIIAYTRWMKNFSSNAFFRAEVTVVNALGDQGPMITSAQTRARQLQENLTNEGVSLMTSAASVMPREKIVLTLQNEDSVYAASVSVNVHLFENALPTNSDYEMAATEAGQFKSDYLRYLPELRGPLISGTVHSRNGGQPLAGNILYLSSTSPHPVFLVSRTDTLGHFYFDGSELPSRRELTWQVHGKDSSMFRVELENDFLSDYSGFASSPYSIDSALFRSLAKRSLYDQIQNAYYQDDSSSLNRDIRPEAFYGTPNKIYNLDDFTRFPSMEDIFREFIPDVIVRKRKESFELRVVNPVNGNPFSEAPLILLDGIPVTEASVIAFDPLKVRRIETVSKRYFYSILALEGIISVETYDGNASGLSLPSGLHTHYKGPALQRQFRAPQYPAPELDRIPDFRTQIYWNPNVVMRPKSVQHFEIFASDFEGNFLVDIQGFTTAGKAIRLQRQITVQR
jgi:hypothetical protein